MESPTHAATSNRQRSPYKRLLIVAVQVLLFSFYAETSLACDGCLPGSQTGGKDTNSDSTKDGACDSTIEGPSTCPKSLIPPPATSSCGKAGKPISLYSGKEFYSKVDLSVNGLYPIVMLRKYDSQTKYDSSLGYGWAFTYDKQLYKYTDGSVVVRRDCGKRDTYILSGGSYTGPKGDRGNLVENNDGSFTLTYAGNTKEYYNADGTLKALEDAIGHRLEMTYDARGRLPLVGSSPFAVDPNTPAAIAYLPRLTKVEERNVSGTLTGRFVDIVYNDSTGRISTITASDGRSVSYVHDATLSPTNGNLLTVNGLESIVSTYGYTDINDSHNLTDIQVGTGTDAWVNTYDTNDRVIKQVHGSNVFSINYVIPTVQSKVTRTILAADNTTVLYTQVKTYDFNANGFLTKTTDALGNEVRIVYNSNMWQTSSEVWQKTGTTLSLLKKTSSIYDNEGNLTSRSVSLVGGEIITSTYTYDQRRVNSIEVRSSLRTQFARTEITYNYDSNGQPSTIQSIKRRQDDGSFLTTQLSYDALGRPTTITLPDNHQIIYEYTASDYVTKIYQQDGATASPYLVKQFGYDAQGNRDKVWDALNNLTQLTYDNLGRVTTIANALNEQTLLTYDPQGNLSLLETGRTTAGGEGQVTQLIYDTRNRLTSIQQKDDVATFKTLNSYTYDSEDNLASSTDAQSRTTTYAYDKLNRRTSVTDPNTNTSTLTYDAAGRVTSVTDALARTTLYSYDKLDRLIQQIDQGVTPSLVSSFTYDHFGNLIKVTDPENRTTAYTYDALSRRTSETKQLGQTLQYVYDTRSRIDYMINARGNKIDYLYETWGPIKQIDQYTKASDTTTVRNIKFAYDLEGNLTSTADSSIQTADMYGITYDALNRRDITTVKYLPFANITLDYNYDRYGNRNGMAYNDGTVQTSSFTYNKLNELITAKLLSTPSFNLAYYLSGEIKNITYPNGLSSDFLYEANGPVQSITTSGTAGQVEQFAYTYDAVLNVDTLTDKNGLHDYNYDGIDRLIKALHPAPSGLPATEDFAYDKVGNREDITDATLFNYDNNNRMLSSASNTYTYDADGNTKTVSDGTTFTFDYTNRLNTYANGTNNSSYVYDTFGKRIKKIVNGVTTWFVWDGSKLLAEYDSTGTRTKRYAYLPGDLLPLQIQDSNGIYNVHADHLSTPRYLTDAAQKVVWTSTHEAFGKAVINENPDGDVNNISFNFRFPGQYYDQETGLHYNYFRYYDPSTGRYITSDPIGLAGGLNTYGYVSGNPLNRFDPYGLDAQEVLDTLFDTGPFDLITNYASSIKAENIAQRSSLPGSINGPQDAYRHCVWSCFMAQNTNQEDARQTGENHEEAGSRGNPPQDPLAEAMDTHNNAVGRQCAADNPKRRSGRGKKNNSKSCPVACMGALTGGKLLEMRNY